MNQVSHYIGVTRLLLLTLLLALTPAPCYAQLGNPMLSGVQNTFTFGDGASATVVHTYDNSGTDVIVTVATNAFNVSTGNIEQGGTQVVLESRALTGGDGIATLGDLSANRTFTIDLNTSADGAGATSNESGMEFATGGVLALLQGCANTEVLKWVDSTSVWNCAADVGINPLTIAGTSELTIATGSVTATCAADNICFWTIDTESDAASDDFSAVVCTAGSMHFWSAADDGRSVVFTLGAGFDFTLDDIDDQVSTICGTTNTMKLLTRENAG